MHLINIVIYYFFFNTIEGLPQNPNNIYGQVELKKNGSQLEIFSSKSAILNWDAFSIGSGERVYFHQDDVGRVLNRILSNVPSIIEGELLSQGAVYLMNPEGIIITKSGHIDRLDLYMPRNHFHPQVFD